MLVSLSVRMFSILVLCPVLLAAGVQTLTIDSQLGTSIEDCFERISIGEQLPSDVIYRNVSELTTRECEQICKQDKQCQSYDYGVGAKGNATCNLGNLDEKQLKENLLRHPDYDVYVRRIGCEQSPPSPIQLDDPGDRNPGDIPGDRPGHRPVFRPVDDKPDYLISGDLGPYSDERPDDYSNPKPDYDSPPSYGSHRPQDIPYKPEKPDPYDQLLFQDPRPQRPSYVPEKPEYHYIVRPNRKPRPQNSYGRPDSPRPDPYGPSNRPSPGYNGQYASNYGQSQYEDNSIYLEINDPVRPYKPSRPIYTQGIYGYGSYSSQNGYTQSSQYHGAEGTGQNSYGNQKPKPQKPGYGSNVDDGYGSYGLKPQKPGYGSSTSDYDGYGQKPQKPAYGSSTSENNGYGPKPQKPPYGSSTSDNNGYGPKPPYGSSTSDYDGYGSKPQKPPYGSSTSDYDGYGYKPQKPTYGSSTSDYDGYGSKPQNSGYGSSSTDNYDGYGSRPQKPSYSSATSDGYGPKPQKPGYGNPSTDNYGGYRPQKPVYGSPHTESSDGYGSRPQKPAYGSTESSDGYGPKPQKPYGSSHHSDGYGPKPQNSGYGTPTDDFDYGSRPQKPVYGNPDTSDGYGLKPQKPTYTSSNNGQSQHTSNQASYGSQYYENRPQTQGGYGTKPSNEGGYGNQGAYGTSSASNQGSYGSQNNNGYGIHGGYGFDQGSSNQGQGNQASYGSSQSSHSSNYYGSSYGNKPSHNDNQGSYNSNQGSYGSTSVYNKPYGSGPYQEKPSYQKPQKPKPSYGTGNEDQGYGNRPNYDKDRPDYVQPGYNNQEESGYGNNPVTSGYGEQPNKTSYLPDIRPVYEYEVGKPDAPSYIAKPNGEVVTSRPMVIGDYGDSGYGRHPGKDGSYKGMACPVEESIKTGQVRVGLAHEAFRTIIYKNSKKIMSVV